MPDWDPEANDLFLQAIEIPAPEDRQRFLEEACAGKPDLRTRVDGLLRAGAEAGSFLERPLEAPELTGAHVPSNADDPAVPLASPGTVIGRYKLLEVIGEGGMGTVWLAEQTEPVRRKVALKVVKAGMDSKQVLARFEMERQALALMDHPNIAKVLDGGATADGRPYFVMELVKGVPITKYCDDHRMPPRQRLELFLAVCQAVQHAHQKGIIHRDIKPSNVLVAPYDGRPVSKVIDFGIAKATGQSLTEKTLFTGLGAVVGTPEYMSPEQAELNNQDIDTRSDVYSLGVLLYELLTGSTPLTRKRLKSAALLEVLRLVREEEAQKPSTRLSGTDELPSVAANRGLEPRRLTGLVRGELDWVILKSLEKDRNRRYETANGFALDLQRYLSDEPVSAGSPGACYRVKKFVRRNRLQVIAGGLVFLALLAGTVGTTFGLFRALAAEGRALTERDEKDVARQQAVDEAEARARAERDTRVALDVMTDEVVDDLLGRQIRMTDQHREFLKKVVTYHARFAAAKADDSEGRIGKAAGSFRVGRIRFFLGELKEAEAAYRAALVLQQQLVAELPAWLDVRHDLVRTYRYLGMVLSGTGRRGPAEEAYGAALTAAEQLTALSPRADFRNTLAECNQFLGNELLLTFQPGKAEAHFLAALAVYQQLVDEFPDVPDYQEGVATCYYDLAGVLIGVHRSKEAEEACRKAIGLAQQLADKFHARPEFREEVVSHYVKLGALLQATDRPKEAEAAWREAVRLGKELVADFPVRPEFIHQLILSQNNLGMLLLETNRLSEAEGLWSETLTLARYLAAQVSSRPDFRLQLVVAYHNVATMFERLRRQTPAEEAYREAVRLGKKLAQDYPHNPRYWHQWVLSNGNLAGFLRVNDRPKEAEVAYRETLGVAKQLTRERNLAQLHYALGVVISKQEGRLDEAVTEYREALRLNSDTPEAHYKPCEVRNELGNALLVKNQLDEAIVEYKKAIGLDPKYANAHNNLGLVLQRKGQWDEAVKEFKKAIDLDPNDASAHNNLGAAMAERNRWDEAVVEYKRAIVLTPTFAMPHHNLGLVLADKKQWDDAISEHKRAIQLDPYYAKAYYHLGIALTAKNLLGDAANAYKKAIGLQRDYAEAHCDLAMVLRLQGQLTASLESYKRGHALGKNHPDWQYPSELWVATAERLVRSEAKLNDVLAKKAAPADNSERFGLLQVCQLQGRHVAAAGLYAEVFAAEPQLADDRRTIHRYKAARVAALAARDEGTDAAELDAKERTLLRGLALDWLRADLEAWLQFLKKEPNEAANVTGILGFWLDEEAFAELRRPEALEKLPEDEQKQWEALWDEVAFRSNRVRERSAPGKIPFAK